MSLFFLASQWAFATLDDDTMRLANLSDVFEAANSYDDTVSNDNVYAYDGSTTANACFEQLCFGLDAQFDDLPIAQFATCADMWRYGVSCSELAGVPQTSSGLVKDFNCENSCTDCCLM